MEQYHYSFHEMQAWLHGGLDAAVSKRKLWLLAASITCRAVARGTGHLHVDIGGVVSNAKVDSASILKLILQAC
jgi:hypothetical protein